MYTGSLSTDHRIIVQCFAGLRGRAFNQPVTCHFGEARQASRESLVNVFQALDAGHKT